MFAYIHRSVPNAVDDEGDAGEKGCGVAGYKMAMQGDQRDGARREKGKGERGIVRKAKRLELELLQDSPGWK